MHLRRLKLAEESILVGQVGAHGIDHVHAYYHLLRRSSRGRKEEDRHKNNRNKPASLDAVHPVLLGDCESVKL
jgi:hypothetical protein